MAAARDLPRHHRRDHHPASASRRRRAARPRRLRAHQDADVRRRVLRLRRPDPVANRARFLLRPRVHQDRAREPNRLPVRLLVRKLVVGARIQPGFQRSAVGSGDPVGFRESRRDLSPAREVALRRLRQQRRRRDRGATRIVADAHVLSDVGDFVGDVLDGDGSESIERESDFQHDQADDRVDRLGQGGDRAWFGVVDRGSVSSVLDLPADGED